MSEQFQLNIVLGNDGMSSPYDVAQALRRVADDLHVMTAMWEQGTDSLVRDVNGNTVGSWFTEEVPS